LHERFFTSKIDIRLTGGEPAYSGCAAFGIERWCMAFDRATWSERSAAGGWKNPMIYDEYLTTAIAALDPGKRCFVE